MDQSERPKFTPEVEAHVEKVQNHAELFAWRQLQALQVLTPIAQRMERAAYPSKPFDPPAAKKPHEIRMHIRNFAQALYLAEANFYPDGPHIKEQFANLTGRILQRIRATVVDVQAAGIKQALSLEHHGLSLEQMESAALDELEGWISKRLAPDPPPDRPPLPPDVQAQMADASEPSNPPKVLTASDTLPASPPTTEADLALVVDASEIQRRANLLQNYKTATGIRANQQIYSARNSCIHKPQFYEWCNGALPVSSATAQNFERFLTSKKPPIPRKPRD